MNNKLYAPPQPRRGKPRHQEKRRSVLIWSGWGGVGQVFLNNTTRSLKEEASQLFLCVATSPSSAEEGAVWRHLKNCHSLQTRAACGFLPYIKFLILDSLQPRRGAFRPVPHQALSYRARAARASRGRGLNVPVHSFVAFSARIGKSSRGIFKLCKPAGSPPARARSSSRLASCSPESLRTIAPDARSNSA